MKTTCVIETLKALGMKATKPLMSIVEILMLVEDNGHTWEVVGKPNTVLLGKVLETHKTGNYIINTQNHVMALIDNELTDTAWLPDEAKVYLLVRIN